MKHELYLIIALLLLLVIIVIIVALVMQTASTSEMKDASITLDSYFNFIERFNTTLPVDNKIDLPVYFINLDRSVDRRRFFEKQIKQYNLTRVHRVPGVDGAHDSSITYYNEFTNMSEGEIGCTLSHLRALRTAYENGEECVMVVEDDASFLLSPHWEKSLSRYVTDAPNDWEMLKPFSDYDYKQVGQEEYFLPPRATYFTVCYIVNRSGMKKILDLTYREGCFLILSSLYYMGTADTYLYNLCPSLRLYHLNPPLIFPDNRSLSSTIHDEDTLTHIRFSAAAIEPYLDKIYRKYLPQASLELCQALLQPRIQYRSTQHPAQIDIVIASTDEDDLTWIEPLMASVKKSCRLYLYHQGSTVLPPAAAQEVIYLNGEGGPYCAYALHIARSFSRPASSFTLFLRGDSHLILSRQDWITLFNHDAPTSLGIKKLPLSHQGLAAPPCLDSLDKWYETVSGQRVSGQIPNFHWAAFLTPRLSRHSCQTWYRIILTLAYGKRVVTSRYVAQMWSYLC